MENTFSPVGIADRLFIDLRRLERYVPQVRNKICEVLGLRRALGIGDPHGGDLALSLRHLYREVAIARAALERPALLRFDPEQGKIRRGRHITGLRREWWTEGDGELVSRDCCLRTPFGIFLRMCERCAKGLERGGWPPPVPRAPPWGWAFEHPCHPPGGWALEHLYACVLKELDAIHVRLLERVAQERAAHVPLTRVSGRGIVLTAVPAWDEDDLALARRTIAGGAPAQAVLDGLVRPSRWILSGGGEITVEGRKIPVPASGPEPAALLERAFATIDEALGAPEEEEFETLKERHASLPPLVGDASDREIAELVRSCHQKVDPDDPDLIFRNAAEWWARRLPGSFWQSPIRTFQRLAEALDPREGRRSHRPFTFGVRGGKVVTVVPWWPALDVFRHVGAFLKNEAGEIVDPVRPYAWAYPLKGREGDVLLGADVARAASRAREALLEEGG